MTSIICGIDLSSTALDARIGRDGPYQRFSNTASGRDGLASIACDSSARTGKRPVHGGREGVRSILFIVASVVRRHEADFQAFSDRLSKAGKPKKAVLVAIAHKLLTRLNAKARDIPARLAAKAATAAEAAKTEQTI